MGKKINFKGGRDGMIVMHNTVCPRSLDPVYILTYHMKLDKT